VAKLTNQASEQKVRKVEFGASKLIVKTDSNAVLAKKTPVARNFIELNK